MIRFADEDNEQEEEKKEKGPASFGQKLLDTRTILIYGEINQKVAVGC